MQGFQNDVMNKCLTHSDLSEIHEHINALENRIDANANQIKINAEVRETIVEFANFPKQINEMQLNVTRMENSQTDILRIFDQNAKRMDQIDNAMKRSQNIQNEMMSKQEVGELSFQDLLNVLNRNLEELQVTMVTKGTFLDLQNEQGQLIQEFSKLRTFKDSHEQA